VDTCVSPLHSRVHLVDGGLSFRRLEELEALLVFALNQMNRVDSTLVLQTVVEFEAVSVSKSAVVIPVEFFDAQTDPLRQGALFFDLLGVEVSEERRHFEQESGEVSVGERARDQL